jgi:hypothetical protein
MFKLFHSKGVVNNSFVSDIPAGTSLDTNAENLNGLAVTITAGVLEHCVANGAPVAGILANQPGDHSYGDDEQGNPIGGVAKLVGENPLFMPVTRDMLIEADTAAAAACVIGNLYDISANGDLINLAASTNDDFKVLRILEGTASAATKVMGVFVDPSGYFA